MGQWRDDVPRIKGHESPFFVYILQYGHALACFMCELRVYHVFSCVTRSSSYHWSPVAVVFLALFALVINFPRVWLFFSVPVFSWRPPPLIAPPPSCSFRYACCATAKSQTSSAAVRTRDGNHRLLDPKYPSYSTLCFSRYISKYFLKERIYRR